MTYISIKQIFDDLLVDPLMKDLPLERLVNYTVEFMKIVGMPTLFEDKVATINIKNYRAQLPCDFYEIKQVREKDNDKVAYISSSNSFGPESRYTYNIKGNFIYISKEEETLEIAYTSIMQDEDGFPCIVDNASFIRALELYIQKKWFTILFNSSKIPAAVLQNVQQEYAFAVGQAQSDLIRPTLDQMQSFTNIMTSLLPRVREHYKSFGSLSSPEVLKF